MPELTDEQLAAERQAAAEAARAEANAEAERRIAEAQQQAQDQLAAELATVNNAVQEWQREQAAAMSTNQHDTDDGIGNDPPEPPVDVAKLTSEAVSKAVNPVYASTRASNRNAFAAQVDEAEWSAFGTDVEKLLDKQSPSVAAHPNAYNEALALVRAQNASKYEDIVAERVAARAAEDRGETYTPAAPPAVASSGALGGSASRAPAAPAPRLSEEQRRWNSRFGIKDAEDYAKWSDTTPPDVLGLNSSN